MEFKKQLLLRHQLAEWLDPPLLGMIHLPPLPGSPGYGGDPDFPLRRALEDAGHLAEAGFGGLVVENYGDTPFFADEVPAITIASMARIATELQAKWPDLPLIVNCLRNDARAALSIAAAVGAQGIRVNVHSGSALTDQGMITGQAAHTLRLRAALQAPVRILADVRVKHAAPLARRSIEEEAADLRHRGRADILLVTGAATGADADPAELEALRDVLGDVPIMVASGVNESNVREWSQLADGAIVGSSLMNGGKAGQGVDPTRARTLVKAWLR